MGYMCGLLVVSRFVSSSAKKKIGVIGETQQQKYLKHNTV
jgi:hypothetical protein